MIKWILALLFSVSSLGFADEGDFVVLPEESVHEGDYFATGGNIEVSGVVKGDVYAFGAHVIVDGRVEGDVIASGGTLEIGGEVLGNARLAGGQVEVHGTIRRNVTIMGGNVQISEGGAIGGNGVITGGMVDLAGRVGGDLTLTASTSRISGQVGDNVKAYVGQLRVTSKASVGGNLEYSSNTEAVIDSGAEIRGKLIYHPSVVQEVFKGKWKKDFLVGSKITGLLMNFLFSFVIGIIFIKMFPKRLKGALEILKKRPWRAFWYGILISVLLPVACLILFITILGFPIALALVALSLLGFYSAKVVPIVYLSNRFFPKMGMKKNGIWVFFWGLILFFLVSHIPFIGGLFSLIFIFLGLGAIVLGKLPKKKSKKA